MPPKSILKKKTAPGRTATGKRARPGQNIRNAAKAEAESLKSKSKFKKGPDGRPLRAGKPGPGIGEVKTGAASATGSNVITKGKGKGKGSKGSMNASVKKSAGGDKDKGKKRARVVEQGSGSDDDDGSGDEVENGFGSDDDMDGAGTGTDEEIDRLNGPKPKSSTNSKSRSTLSPCRARLRATNPILKEYSTNISLERKRPTTATEFGSTLTSLLGDLPAPPVQKPSTKSLPKSSKTIAQQPILALSRNRLPPSRAKLALERKAEEAVKKAKVDRVERARVTDVMEGWGQPGGSQEFERGLRKTAQRGGESYLVHSIPFLSLTPPIFSTATPSVPLYIFTWLLFQSSMYTHSRSCLLS